MQVTTVRNTPSLKDYPNEYACEDFKPKFGGESEPILTVSGVDFCLGMMRVVMWRTPLFWKQKHMLSRLCVMTSSRVVKTYKGQDTCIYHVRAIAKLKNWRECQKGSPKNQWELHRFQGYFSCCNPQALETPLTSSMTAQKRAVLRDQTLFRMT